MRDWSWEQTDNAPRIGLMVIAFSVRERRLLCRLSQEQLAFRAGLNLSTVSRLENGRLPTMRIATLARIVGVLELGPRFLFPGDPPAPTRRLPGFGR